MDISFDLMVAGADKVGEQAVNSPWDLSQIGEVPMIDGKGAEQALANAYAIYRDRKRWLPPQQRMQILQKTANIMQQRFDQLAFETTAGFEGRGHPRDRRGTQCNRMPARQQRARSTDESKPRLAASPGFYAQGTDWRGHGGKCL